MRLNKWAIFGIIGIIGLAMTKRVYSTPEKGKDYEPYFIAYSAQEGIPPNLLSRVAYQESRFRTDIITGQKISGAGAQGIMQIVPKWHPGVDPLNPQEAIEYAAKYLRKLYEQFGTWPHALAAYNWGPGNYQKYLDGKIKTMPKETRDYVAQITRDVWTSSV